MNGYGGFEPRKYIEEEHSDIGVGENPMRSINEKYVPMLELIEDREIVVFEWFP